jgi:hypothetical protein
MLNKDVTLVGTQGRKRKKFLVILFSEQLSCSHCIQKFLGREEKQHIILKGAALFQKEIAAQGGRHSSFLVLEALEIARLLCCL